MDDHQAFIENLGQSPASEDLYNPYAPGNPNNVIRRTNLLRYLHDMTDRKPDTLMVMEAPGYRGCRLTGVPVTSRKILLEGVPELGIFGLAQGYQDVSDPGFERIYGEQSATIVWSTLARIGSLPLIWNTFPLHPHKMGRPLTNRRPRKAETQLGIAFSDQLIERFAIARIVAVGNVAHETLSGMGIECTKVRHPAQGGRNDFVAGLNAVFGKG
jgi:hypothetical protein